MSDPRPIARPVTTPAATPTVTPAATPTASPDYRADDLAASVLARRAKEGDNPAFSELVTLLSGRLYRYFRVRGFGDADAQDLVQDTVLRAHAGLARYDADRRFLPWLFTIASRVAANHYRRARSTEPLPANLPSRRLARASRWRPRTSDATSG